MFQNVYLPIDVCYLLAP